MNSTKAYRRGSVLMEFIVVLPIYLVLFGGMVMLGDMSLHATRLTSAERLECLVANRLSTDNCEWNSAQRRGNSVQRQNEKGKCDHYADKDIVCPFAYSTGVKVRETYRLPQWMRGQLAYAHWFFNRALGTQDKIDDGQLYRANGFVGMYSKSVERDEKVFFTLHRFDYKSIDKNNNGTWRSNRRAASDLLMQRDVGCDKCAWLAVGEEVWLTSGSDGDDLNVATSRENPAATALTGWTDCARYNPYPGFENFR